jgi:hypothetical protein
MPDQGTDWRHIGGILAGPIFVVAFLTEGATRADYNPLRHPVSSLAIGEFGWTQAANFLVTGALLMLFASIFWRRARWTAVFVGLAGFGLVGAGLFVTDPLSGYPPGTAGFPSERTIAGRLHDLFSVLFFLGMPFAAISIAWRFARTGDGRWAAYSAVSAAAFTAFFVLAALGFRQVAGFVEWGGLFQRLSIVSGLFWAMLLALIVRTNGVPATDK